MAAATPAAMHTVSPSAAPALPPRGAKYAVNRSSSAPNLPLQGIRLLVNIAIMRSRGELMIRQPVTPTALHPSPMHMVSRHFPAASAFGHHMIQIIGHPGQITQVFQQGKERKEDRHRRQHHRDHPSGSQHHAVQHRTGQPPWRPPAHPSVSSPPDTATVPPATATLMADLPPATVSHSTKNRSRSISGIPVFLPVSSRSHIELCQSFSTYLLPGHHCRSGILRRCHPSLRRLRNRHRSGTAVILCHHTDLLLKQLQSLRPGCSAERHHGNAQTALQGIAVHLLCPVCLLHPSG